MFRHPVFLCPFYRLRATVYRFPPGGRGFELPARQFDLLFCLPHKKVGKKSYRSIKIARFTTGGFLHAKPKLTPPSSSLGQGSSSTPRRKPSLKSYAIFLRRPPLLQNFMLISMDVGFAEYRLPSVIVQLIINNVSP